jgi:hypothetical protein
VYYFPLHHIFDIMIFHLNVFRSIKKHWVLKELYKRLLLSSYNSSHDQVNMSEACEATLLRTLDVIYFAFVVLKATEFCFLLHQGTMANFTITQQLDVLFRSTILSAQSVSAYPCKLNFTLGGISQTISNCALCISQYMLYCYPVNLSRLTHGLTKHIHCIT